MTKKNNQLVIIFDSKYTILDDIINELIYTYKIDYKKEYVSKYNKSVSYDYNPFYIEGFNIKYTLQWSNVYAKYINYIFHKMYGNVTLLDKCYNLESEVSEYEKTQYN